MSSTSVTPSFTTSFRVDEAPEDVFNAITNVRGWWSGEIDGSADRLGSEFTYRYQDLHRSTQRVTELVPGATVVWRVTDAHLTFTKDPSEWAGTEIAFDIARTGSQTEVRFTHRGLVSDFECFDQCSNAWGFFLNGSLRRLITSGEGPAVPPWA